MQYKCTACVPYFAGGLAINKERLKWRSFARPPCVCVCGGAFFFFFAFPSVCRDCFSFLRDERQFGGGGLEG